MSVDVSEWGCGSRSGVLPPVLYLCSRVWCMVCGESEPQLWMCAAT